MKRNAECGMQNAEWGNRIGLWLLAMICLLMLPLAVCADHSIEKVSLTSGLDMQRADLFAWKTSYRPEAALVLCPGCNGSGEGLIRQRVWQEFAKKHKLGLAGLSFASDVALLTRGRGYYYASQGSGELLLDGIRKIYGKELPLLFYGFSGGAHFTARFVEWKPDRMVAWCAYSAGWWDEPRPTENNPPGVIACGDQDARYGASLFYFKQGRATGKPWLWVSLPRTDHEHSQALDDFVRQYFAAVLEGRSDGSWVDIDSEKEVSSHESEQYLALTAWLPDAKLCRFWKKIHEP